MNHDISGLRDLQELVERSMRRPCATVDALATEIVVSTVQALVADADNDIFTLVARDVGMNHRIVGSVPHLVPRSLVGGPVVRVEDGVERVAESMRCPLIGVPDALGTEIEIFADKALVPDALHPLAASVTHGRMFHEHGCRDCAVVLCTVETTTVSRRLDREKAVS